MRRVALLNGLLLLFCGWCILLGGLAGLTDACYDIQGKSARNRINKAKL